MLGMSSYPTHSAINLVYVSFCGMDEQIFIT